MKKYSRVCAKVNLDAIYQNISNMKKNIPKETSVIAVIKADGYGHGAVPIAKHLQEIEYVWGFAVATLDEAVVLRKEGIHKPLFVLGCIFPDQYSDIFTYDLEVTVYTLEAAAELSNMAEMYNKPVAIHVKLDTGMGRIGFPVSDKGLEEIKEISKMSGIKLSGLFTHFAKADEIDKTYTDEQIEKFLWMKEQLEKHDVNFAYYHCSNSAGIIDVKEAHMNLVRAGIATYGLYPSQEVDKDAVELHPALSLISHVSYVKYVEAGTAISYGGTFVTNKRSKIATIPVGYGDGYPRSLSNVGYVLIKGQKAPIVGRVCMDQFMVDVTNISDVRFGEKVTLIGFDKEAHISVEELGDISGRFNYEFVCDLGKRIPREYITNGMVTEQKDYF